jgi:hypothetical protein
MYRSTCTVEILSSLHFTKKPGNISKIQMGDKSKGVGNTLYPAKKYSKNKNMYGIEQWDFTYATF